MEKNKNKNKNIIKSVIEGIRYGIKANPPAIFLAWILNTIYTLEPLLFNIIWASLIDTAVKGIESNSLTIDTLIRPFLLFGVVEIVKSISERVNYFFRNMAFDSLELKAHNDVMGKYSSLDVQSLEDPEVNNLFQVVRSGYNWQPRTLIFSFGDLMSSFCQIILAVTILLKISPISFAIIIITNIPSLLINFKFSTVGWGIWNAEASKYRKFNIVKAFLTTKENLIEASVSNSINYLLNTIDSILSGYHDKRKKLLVKHSGALFIADLLRLGGLIGGVYFLITLAVNESLSIGELMLASATFVSLTPTFSSFLKHISGVNNCGLYIREYLKFQNIQPKVDDGTITLPKLESPPQIEFKNVSFKYPHTERLILNNLSLSIKPGMKVALVGENGVGKTTLIKLLLHFYDLTGGSILVDNKNLKDIERESLEQNVGLLTQHFNTYKAFTLKENIMFGDINKKKVELEVFEAAKKSKVDSFVDKYPDKYNQILSAQFEDGIDPSWGQWQRIGISRVFYKDPSIIILDEPTSAIDAQAEYEIFQNINKHTKDKTVIYVSHRYSTVRDADLINVIKDGTIIESGTHEELMKLDGEYKKNFELQASGYK